MCYVKSSSIIKAISEAKIDTFKIPLGKPSHANLIQSRRGSLSINSRLFLGNF